MVLERPVAGLLSHSPIEELRANPIAFFLSLSLRKLTEDETPFLSPYPAFTMALRGRSLGSQLASVSVWLVVLCPPGRNTQTPGGLLQRKSHRIAPTGQHLYFGELYRKVPP